MSTPLVDPSSRVPGIMGGEPAAVTTKTTWGTRLMTVGSYGLKALLVTGVAAASIYTLSITFSVVLPKALALSSNYVISRLSGVVITSGTVLASFGGIVAALAAANTALNPSRRFDAFLDRVVGERQFDKDATITNYAKEVFLAGRTGVQVAVASLIVSPLLTAGAAFKTAGAALKTPDWLGNKFLSISSTVWDSLTPKKTAKAVGGGDSAEFATGSA